MALHSTHIMSATEHYGAMTELKIVYRVTGVGGATISAKAEDALATAGVPAYLSSPTEFPNLKCITRDAAFVPGSTDAWDVTCTFVSVGALESGFYWHLRSSLSQETREKDYFGVPLSVSYTYPLDYIEDERLRGQTITQGGEVNILFPEYEMTGTGIVGADYPLVKIEKWLGHTNATEWKGGHAGGWMCTNVTADPHDSSTSPAKWIFTLAFQYKWGGWNPTIAFIDPNTGKRPPDLIAGVGYKTVKSYPTLEYNDVFSSATVMSM